MCEYKNNCWRNSYTRLHQQEQYNEPPERMDVFLAGFAHKDMLKDAKGKWRGVYCELMPGVSGQNYCPFILAQDYTDCHEYKKEKRKEERLQKARERLAKYPNKNPRTLIPKKTRREVAQRCRYKCVYCGVNAQKERTQVDHRIPLALGGTNEDSNLVLACWKCNNDKGTEIWEVGCRMNLF